MRKLKNRKNFKDDLSRALKKAGKIALAIITAPIWLPLAIIFSPILIPLLNGLGNHH